MAAKAASQAMKAASSANASAAGTRTRTQPLKMPTSKASTSAASGAKPYTRRKSPERKCKQTRKVTKDNKEISPEPGQEESIKYNVEVTNSFNILSDSDQSDEDDEMESLPPMSGKSIRIPPIIIRDHFKNPKEMFLVAHGLVTSPLNIKCTRSNTIFLCSNAKDHGIILDFLNKKNINYYTYPLPGEGLTKMVLRGLSSGISIEDVHHELSNKGFPPQKIVQLKEKNNGKPIPIFICMFKAGTQVQEIRKIDRLCFMCVRWEKYKNRAKFILCYRCLSFNHTSKTCRNPEVCIKCAGPHSNLDCKSPTIKCGNCKNAHWANSLECPMVQKAMEKRRSEQKPKLPGGPPKLDSAHFPNLSSRRETHQPSPPAPPTWPQHPLRKEVQEETSHGLLHELLSLLKLPNITSLLGKIVKLLKMVSQAKSGAEIVSILLEEGASILE